MARRVGWVAAAVVASVWLVWAPAAAAPLLGRADLSAGPTLSGRAVVWAEVRPARVAVLRLDAAARPIVLARTERPVDVRAAGRLVAWVPLRAPSARVVVYDLSARRIIYRVRLPRGLVVHAWDLQADGKVAIALGPDRYVGVRPRVFLATPRRRRPRPLGLRIVTTRSADAGLVFRLARDRLLVVRPTARSAADGELA